MPITNLKWYLDAGGIKAWIKFLLFLGSSILMGFLEAKIISLIQIVVASLGSLQAGDVSAMAIQGDGITRGQFYIFRNNIFTFTTVGLAATGFRILLLKAALSFGATLTSNAGIILYKTLFGKDYCFLSDLDKNVYQSRFLIDLERVRAGLTMLFQLILSLFVVIFITAELFHVNGLVTTISLASLSALYISFYLLASRSVRNFGDNIRGLTDTQMTEIDNSFSLLRFIINGRIQSERLQAFVKNELTLRRLYTRLQFRSSYPKHALEGFVFIVTLMIILIIGEESGQKLIPFILIYGTGLTRLFPAFQSSYSSLNEYKANEVFVTAIRELNCDLVATTPYQGNASIRIITCNNETNEQLGKMVINLENISFKYNDIDRPVINGLNLIATEGDRIVISGPSGCGKSTLMDILSGFLMPSSGIITISEHLLENISAPNSSTLSMFPYSYKKSVGFVSAKTFIIRSSLSYNITLIEDNRVDHEWLTYCLEVVQLNECFARRGLTVDFNTVLSCDQLSNGEIQRIGIARILYHKPKVLILDESLNSIDARSSARILSNLTKFPKLSLSLLISHQPMYEDWITRQLSICDGRLS